MFAVDAMLNLELRTMAWNFWAPCFVRILKSQPQLLTLGRKDHDLGEENETNGVGIAK